MALDPITGTLISTAVGTGLNFGLGALFGGGGGGDDGGAKQVEKQNRQIYEFMYDEDDGEAYRQRDYQVEAIDRDLRNFIGNADTQIQNLVNERAAQDAIQMFGFNRNMEAYNKQVDQVNQQLDFNDQALNRAFARQDNYMLDQQIGLAFQGRKVMLDYVDNKDKLGLRQRTLDQDRIYGYRSNRLQQQANDLTIRQQRAEAAFAQQEGLVAGLKAEGQARNSGGSGRSAGKTVQATMAENGAARARIAGMLSFQGEQYLLNTKQNVIALQKLNDDYSLETVKVNQALSVLDQQKDLSMEQINESYLSLERADNLAREDIIQQKKQADANAVNSLPLMPELGPLASDFPLPEIYIPEMTYPMEIREPPLTETIGIQPPSSLQQFLPGIQQGLGQVASLLGKSLVPQYNQQGQGQYSGITNFNPSNFGINLNTNYFGGTGGGNFNMGINNPINVSSPPPGVNLGSFPQLDNQAFPVF